MVSNGSVKLITEKVDTKKDIKKKLDMLAKESKKTLLEISSIFPLQLFPDKLIIDINKMSIVRNYFIQRQVFPVIIEDLKTVTMQRGLFLASLSFEISGYEKNPQPITHLWPNDATLARQHLIALISARKKEIDLEKLDPGEVKKKLLKIGKEDHPSLI